MNILILHRMGNPRSWRHSPSELQLGLPTYAPRHNYLVHNASLPLPRFVRNLEFDGIILGASFLGSRRYPTTFERILAEFDFLRFADAFKIALPQDDYCCSALLDCWVSDWKVDKVYTVCPQHWDVLYPNYLGSGGNLALGYTGYISPALIQRSSSPTPHAARKLDVCYRAKMLSPSFGRMGVAKGTIVAKFLDAFRDKSLVVDISVDPKDVIPGQRWLDFVESARFTLGSNSGSSLLDPEGRIRENVRAYVRRNPGATFEEVEAECFPGLDGKYVFTAISPRVLEAGMLQTGQILFPGPYSGFLEPWVHYVPLAEDFSNKREVSWAIKDPPLLRRIASACKQRLLDVPELRLETYVRNLEWEIEDAAGKRRARTSDARFRRAAYRHRVYTAVAGSLKWRLGRVGRSVFGILGGS
jgi:hypothetical protein